MQEIGKAIKGFLKNAGLEKGVNQNKAIHIWPRVVGLKVSENTEAQSVESGTLVVKTKNSAWRQELVFKQTEIIQGLNKELGKNTIKSIRFI